MITCETGSPEPPDVRRCRGANFLQVRGTQQRRLLLLLLGHSVSVGVRQRTQRGDDRRQLCINRRIDKVALVRIVTIRHRRQTQVTVRGHIVVITRPGVGLGKGVQQVCVRTIRWSTPYTIVGHHVGYLWYTISYFFSLPYSTLSTHKAFLY